MYCSQLWIIDAGFQCLLTARWKRTAQMLCWPPTDWQVLAPQK